MTVKLPLVLLAAGLMACEQTDKESTEAQTFEEWSDSYMNARQSESTEDVCAEFYQDCIDAGYAEQDCSTRTEECAQWSDNDGGNEDREDDSSETTEEESECERAAQQAYDDCLNSGSSPEDCRSVYAEAYDDCIGR